MNARPNIVLFHAAWADGYCWGGVIERRQQPLATFASGDVIAVPAGETRSPITRVVATHRRDPVSDVSMVSHPGDLAQLIEPAAEAAPAKS
jgi:hypothetical protein